jgi:hypothetical protein
MRRRPLLRKQPHRHHVILEFRTLRVGFLANHQQSIMEVTIPLVAPDLVLTLQAGGR